MTVTRPAVELDQYAAESWHDRAAVLAPVRDHPVSPDEANDGACRLSHDEAQWVIFTLTVGSAENPPALVFNSLTMLSKDDARRGYATMCGRKTMPATTTR